MDSGWLACKLAKLVGRPNWIEIVLLAMLTHLLAETLRKLCYSERNRTYMKNVAIGANFMEQNSLTHLSYIYHNYSEAQWQHCKCFVSSRLSIIYITYT